MSVKLNLGIIITSKTTEAYLSSPAPASMHPARYTRKGVVSLIAGHIHDGLIEGIVSLQVQWGGVWGGGVMSRGSEEERARD